MTHPNQKRSSERSPLSRRGASIFGVLTGAYLCACAEALYSGASLAPALALWLLLTPLIALGSVIVTRVVHAYIRLIKADTTPSGRAKLLTGVTALAGLALLTQSAHLTLLSMTRDPALIGPVLALLIIAVGLVLAPLLDALSERLSSWLKGRSTAVMYSVMIFYPTSVLGYTLSQPIELLIRAELGLFAGLIALALLSASLTSTLSTYSSLRDAESELSTHRVVDQSNARKWITTLLISGHIGLIYWGGRVYSEDDHARHLLEEVSGVTSRVARIARRLSDRDFDGFGTWLGGADCDDDSPGVHPDAIEIPNNGVDEDCDGEDLTQAHIDADAPDVVAKQDRLKTRDETQSSLSDESVHTEPATPTPKRHLLVITVDALRADRVFWGGYHRKLTPHLEDLSREGLLFLNAYAPAASTRYSVPSLFTGARLSELMFDWRGRYLHLDAGQTLFEQLKRARYRTAAYTGSLLTEGMWHGLERGFDRYQGLKRAQLRGRSSPEVTRAGIAQLRQWCRDDETDHKTGVDSEGVSRVFTQRPWAMWLHYLDPHEPYLTHQDHSFGDTPSDRYDAEIASTDTQIGALLKTLKRCGYDQNTIIALTSDHGEEFEEHGKRYHGKQLFDESVKVPLMIHVPGAPSVKVTEPRSALDLSPTLIDLLKLPSSPKAHIHYSGVSHAQRLSGGPPPPERPFFVYRLHNELPRLLSLALIDAPYKLILEVRSRRARLYNIERDPSEQRDLSQEEPKRHRAMLRRARAEVRRLRRHAHRQLAEEGLGAHPPENLSRDTPRALTPQLELLAAQARTISLGAQELQEVSAWVKLSEALQRPVSFEARWRSAGGRVITRPLRALAGLYPSARWTAGEVIRLVSAERVSLAEDAPVELVFKERGGDHTTIQLRSPRSLKHK